MVLETAVTFAPDPARDQMPVDGLPTAAVIDQMWQANPFQKLLPVDWEAITQALSTLGVRSMADPVNATMVAANLNMRLLQGAAETWIGTAARWWGLATPTEDKLPGPAADRRFEAPEWEQHPFFRVVKQCYLAIAAQLREEADREVPDPDRTASPHVPRPTVDRCDKSYLVFADEPGGSPQGVGDGWR